MTDRNDNVQDAAPVGDDLEARLDSLEVGPPFAMAQDCELVEKSAGGAGGCTATLKCTCGQALRIDLLMSGWKGCPKCKTRYTHVLLVCAEDNDEMVRDALEFIFEANGVEFPEDSEDDAGDDGAAEVVNPDEDDDSEGHE